MKFSWFPGHMRKALRLLREAVPLTDMVLLMLDARIPGSSINPELLKIIGTRPCIYLLNKADLAEPTITSEWINFYSSKGIKAISISANTSGIASKLSSAIEDVRKKLMDKKAEKKRLDNDIRIMVLGVPNSGKSTLINKIAGKTVAIAGKKAGLTRGLQWLSLSNNIQMLDVPGIFYPRLESEEQAWHLAAVGAAREVAFASDDLAFEIVKFLKEKNNDFVREISSANALESLTQAGLKKNFILKGGKVDFERTAMWIIISFREGKFGRFSLERPLS